MTSAALQLTKPFTRDVSPAPVVYVVDDDVSIRESLELLIQSAGWRALTFSSAAAFFMQPALDVPGCLVLDFSLPDLNGLEIQRRVAIERRSLPIIFITGHGDVTMSVEAMKAGALEFLTKPFSGSTLLTAIEKALDRSRVALGREAEIHALRERYKSLSRREREVMALVVAGRLNKQVGAQLRISEITVKAHRGKAMRKMNAASFADLVMMAGRLAQA